MRPFSRQDASQRRQRLLRCVQLAAVAVIGVMALVIARSPGKPLPSTPPGRLTGDEDVSNVATPGGEPANSRAQKQVVNWHEIKLCQALGPAAPHPIWGVDSAASGGCGEVGWDARGCVDWQAYAQGEYIGHARSAHVGEYRIRVDDRIAFVFRLTRKVSGKPYEFQVGDTLRVESLTGDAGSNLENSAEVQDNIRRDLVIQPDGTISLPLLGQVRSAGMTVDGLRQHLEALYQDFYKVPAITVTPISINTRLDDLISAVDARQGTGGLQLETTVNPDGKLYLPGLGAIYAQGLTIGELKWEVDARYDAEIPGVAVTPVLTQRAARFVFVLGEVQTPGRYTLEGPTTLMGAIALAGGWNPGANLRQVVVFRRSDDWRLMATMLDIKGALYGRRPTPADEIWINDSDVVVIPKSPIQVADEFISLWQPRDFTACSRSFRSDSSTLGTSVI